jgi:hypothetical protein
MAERKRMTISVTEEDIAKAHRGDSFSCVVVQAIARMVPLAHHIEVDSQTIRWTEGDERYLWLTPLATQDYVIAFDAGEEISPFKSQLTRRLPIRRQERTEAGVALDNARGAVKRAQQTKERVERAAEREEATPKQVRAAAAKVAKAERMLSETKVAHHGERQTVRKPGPGTTRAPRRVITKERVRSYGQRALRINWPENEDHTPAEARKLAEQRLGRKIGPSL